MVPSLSCGLHRSQEISKSTEMYIDNENNVINSNSAKNKTTEVWPFLTTFCIKTCFKSKEFELVLRLKKVKINRYVASKVK